MLAKKLLQKHGCEYIIEFFAGNFSLRFLLLFGDSLEILKPSLTSKLLFIYLFVRSFVNE